MYYFRDLIRNSWRNKEAAITRINQVVERRIWISQDIFDILSPIVSSETVVIEIGGYVNRI